MVPSLVVEIPRRPGASLVSASKGGAEEPGACGETASGGEGASDGDDVTSNPRGAASTTATPPRPATTPPPPTRNVPPKPPLRRYPRGRVYSYRPANSPRPHTPPQTEGKSNLSSIIVIILFWSPWHHWHCCRCGFPQLAECSAHPASAVLRDGGAGAAGRGARFERLRAASCTCTSRRSPCRWRARWAPSPALRTVGAGLAGPAAGQGNAGNAGDRPVHLPRLRR